MLGSENGFLDIPSEAFQAPPPPIDPLPGVPAATKAPRGKSSKAVSPAPTKGWGWLKEYPYDLSKLDIHALVREMGLNPGPFARYGAGEKCRLHCILPAEHTNATDDDSAVVMVPARTSRTKAAEKSRSTGLTARYGTRTPFLQGMTPVLPRTSGE